MTDEVLKELWDVKDRIAKEHGYNIEGLAEYFINKQVARKSRFQPEDLKDRPRLFEEYAKGK